jgi:hypothetical protein
MIQLTTNLSDPLPELVHDDKGPGAQEPDECESLTSGSVVALGRVTAPATMTGRHLCFGEPSQHLKEETRENDNVLQAVNKPRPE